MAREALKIASLRDHSHTGLERSILCVGDEVLEVCGQETRDQVDFHFYVSGEERAELKLRKKSGEIKLVSIKTEDLKAMEIRFSPMRFRKCRNKCPFCFVDQMPKGLRRSLYAKDEDFRLSFLYGNFTTMNDLTDADIEKIICQGLSPQYVSVHAVDEEGREKVFGRPMKRNILRTLETLASAGITIHTQIVLCPGLNDGENLERSIEALEALDPNVKSLSVVPVGLTKHRAGLPRIEALTVSEMHEVISAVESYQEKFLAGKRGSRFVFLSDEWYLESGRELPSYESYELFDQIDNGVGMTRHFLRAWEEDVQNCGVLKYLGRATIVTGTLGEKVFSRYAFPILEKAGVEELPELRVVKNRFFGESVTVSGLLTAGDISSEIGGLKSDSVVFLPENVLSHDDRFLDGTRLGVFRRALSCSVVVGSSLIKNIGEQLSAGGGDA